MSLSRRIKMPLRWSPVMESLTGQWPPFLLSEWKTCTSDMINAFTVLDVMSLGSLGLDHSTSEVRGRHVPYNQ